MTHQNHQTNGASLEDCHTNFFALTDLCGIKWRKLVQGERPNASSYPLDDPVLRSYSKCLEVDILCVWRRVAAPKPAEQDQNVFDISIQGPVTGGSVIHPPLSLTAAKELWIFWYGEEPDLTDLVDPELLKSSEGEKGSWEGGLSYECRSLLFKALHNVIERCLLSRDVVRLGRWFVQPSSNGERMLGKSSLHLSLSFAFFVHGDSTVCASMDIREHPPVRPLMIKHLEEAQAQQGNSNSSGNNGRNNNNHNNNNNSNNNSSSGISSSDMKPRSVILAPFGLTATLTGQSYKASDPQTQKVLDDWSAFYPISNKNINLSESADTVPPLVEIMTGGVKMRYPSKYVLVTDIDDWSPPPSSNGSPSLSQPTVAKSTAPLPASSLTAAVSNALGATSDLNNDSKQQPAADDSSSSSSSKPLMNPPLTVPESPSNDLGNQNSMSSAAINNLPAVLIPERVWQDCIMHATPTIPPPQQSPDSAVGESGGVVTIKTEPSSNASSTPTSSSSSGSSNAENNASMTAAQAALVDANANSVWEITDPLVKVSCSCIKSNQNCGAGGSTPYGGPPSYCRNPLSIGESHPLPSEESPASAAPSPMQPSSVSQPMSVPSGDQLITMSPHPPASNNPRSVQPATPGLDHLDKNTPAPTPTDQHDSKSITASPYHTPSHPGGVLSVEAPSSQQPQQLQQQQQQQQSQQPSSQQLVGNNLSSTSSSSSGGTTNSSPGNLPSGPIGMKIKSEDTSFGDSMMFGTGPSIYSRLNPIINHNQITKREQMLQILQSLKRPSLSSRDYEGMVGEESPSTSQLLYDYSAIDAWMNHPVKRFRPNEDSKLNQQMRSMDLYADQKHSERYLQSQLNSGPEGAMKQDQQDPLALPEDTDHSTGALLSESQIKTEIGCERREGDGPMLEAHEIKKEKDDGSLFTEQGLTPALNDLDQLFAVSDNYHDDSDMHANTSPASTKSGGGCMEDMKRFSGSGHTMNAGILSPKELSQMFPTPPSLEHHPNSSPGGGGCMSDGIVIDTLVEPTAAVPVLGSPQEEPIDDWSYVFLPPSICKYVGSSKYAPLQQLPSQLMQPAVTLPLTCVYKSSSQLRKEKQERDKLIKLRELQEQQETLQHQQQQQQQAQLENIPPNAGSVGNNTPAIKQETPLTVPQPLSTPNSLTLNGAGHPYSNPPSQGPQPLSRPPSVNSLPGGMMGSGANMLSPSPIHNGLINNNMFHPGMGMNVPLRQGMSPISPATPGGCTPGGGNSMRVPTPQGSCSLPYPSPISASGGSMTIGNNIGSPNPLNPMSFRRTPILPPPPYDVAVASPATSTTSSYNNKQFGMDEGPATPCVTGGNGTPAQRITIETSAILVNVLLYDTSLNIFRDHNFNSCTLCVCNAGQKWVGNIRGADSGPYLALPGTSFIGSAKGGDSASGGSSEREAAKSTPSSVSQFNGNNHNNNGAFGMMDSPAGGTGGGNSALVAINTNNLQNGYLDEDPIKCTCGFSAVVNRRLAHRAGLFYEDELEITGMAEDPAVHKKNSLLQFLLGKGDYSSSGINCDISPLPLRIMDLLRQHCAVIQSSSNSIHRAVARFQSAMTAKSLANATVHMLEYSDANDVISLALEQSRLQAINENKMDDGALVKAGGLIRGVMNVHKWPYLRAGGPKSNQDIVRIMKSMQPLLQDAFHKKCTTRLWDAPYTIQGPLTWRQFHRLAGRGTGQCEPQPVPSLVVGYEKDWLSLSPYSIQYWDKLLLEPYSYPRDIAYVVVLPDNDYVVTKVKSYFKELSTTYEMCKLGRHNPIKGWDGILRVGSNRVLKETQNSSMDEWFTSMGDTRLSEMLRLYAQTCQQQLAPYLSKVPSDKSLLDPPENHNVSASAHSLALAQASSTPNRDGPGQSPMPPPPPSTPDPSQPGDKAPSTPKSDNDQDNRDNLNTSGSTPADRMQHEDDGKEPPHIVLYMVEPFTCGTDAPEIERLACLSLLRCYSNILSTVPDSIRSNISVQLISLENIMELGRSRNRLRLSDHMRSQALSIFSQSRRYMQHLNNVKSLTGFGTAANAEQFMKNKDEKNRAPYKLYTPPYVLAKVCEKKESSESFGQTSIKQQCSIMYCSYCLSEDQSWLLAVATDDRGEFLETVTINIDIPNRVRRKRASARRLGLQKLMDFILGLISQTVQPWRIVIGRIGRIGHGELKGWSWLLSKQNLQKASKHLKDICEQCSLLHPVSVPSILSACLVTLEPDSKLRVMPDQFTPDERFSQLSMQSPLTTPQDVTCTHILVFPTSARTQSAQSAFVAEHINDELGLTLDGNLDDLGLGEDCDEDGLGDLFDNWEDIAMPQQMPEDSRQGSPIGNFEGQRQSPGDSGSNCAQNLNGYMPQEPEDFGSLAQQPMAIGYLVSTAPTGRMPPWFWSSCPHLENVCPVFLRIALHLNSFQILQNNDDPMMQSQSTTEHPLDSNMTADVLRFVLEGYNVLSWLAMDSNTQDRLSCLPIHVQVLMQLYHMMAALA